MSILSKKYTEITDKELKTAIKEKFGYLARFCKIAKFDLYEVNKMFLSRNVEKKEKFFNSFMAAANKKVDQKITGELTDTNVLMIKTCLYNNYKSVNEFCRVNPEFGKEWISKLFAGGVNKVTPHVELMCKVLSMKIK